MRWQIYGVWASLAASALGIGLIVSATNPDTASVQVKILFFITLFILFLSAATAVIFSIKNRLVRLRALSDSAFDPIFYDSFLRGLFMSIIFTILLLIKRFF